MVAGALLPADPQVTAFLSYSGTRYQRTEAVGQGLVALRTLRRTTVLIRHGHGIAGCYSGKALLSSLHTVPDRRSCCMNGDAEESFAPRLGSPRSLCRCAAQYLTPAQLSVAPSP